MLIILPYSICTFLQYYRKKGQVQQSQPKRRVSQLLRNGGRVAETRPWIFHGCRVAIATDPCSSANDNHQLVSEETRDYRRQVDTAIPTSDHSTVERKIQKAEKFPAIGTIRPADFRRPTRPLRLRNRGCNLNYLLARPNNLPVSQTFWSVVGKLSGI